MLRRPPDWWADAACKEAPPGVSWFPERGDNGKAAKAVCMTCLVRTECLSWSLDQGPDLDGIFGGASQRERRAMRTLKPGRPRKEAA